MVLGDPVKELRATPGVSTHRLRSSQVETRPPKPFPGFTPGLSQFRLELCISLPLLLKTPLVQMSFPTCFTFPGVGFHRAQAGVAACVST